MMIWYEAWNLAYVQWDVVVQHGSWHLLLLEAAYIAVAALCYSARQTSRLQGGSGRSWFLAAFLLVLLGINALYRVDVLMTNFARVVARQEGWYNNRQEWQFGFLLLFGIASLFLWNRLQTKLSADREGLVAVWGLGLLIVLVTLRLISFHNTDALLNQRVAGLSLGSILECAGLLLLATGAVRRLDPNNDPNGDSSQSSMPD